HRDPALADRLRQAVDPARDEEAASPRPAPPGRRARRMGQPEQPLTPILRLAPAPAFGIGGRRLDATRTAGYRETSGVARSAPTAGPCPIQQDPMTSAAPRSYVWLFWLLAVVGLVTDQVSKYGTLALLYQNETYRHAAIPHTWNVPLLPGAFDLQIHYE